MQRSRAHREALGMGLPQAGVTGLGGPVRWTRHHCYNRWTASERGGPCSGTHPCGFPGRHRLAGGGGCMANLGRDRPHGVPSGLSGFNMAAIDIKNLYEPPSTISQFGGAVQPNDMRALAEKVLLSIFAQGQKAAAARGCISALKAVAPAMGQAVENFQGGSAFPGTAAVRRARLAPAHGRIVLQGRGVESLCRGGPILCHALQSGRNIVAPPIEHLQSGNYVPGDQTRPSPDHETTGAIRTGMGYVAPQDRTR